MDRILLIGSYCGESNYKEIQKLYRKNISVSNSEYERMLFNALNKENHQTYMFGSPSVGVYPKTCKKAKTNLVSNNDNIIVCNYLTNRLFNHLSKSISMKNNLKKYLRKLTIEKEKIVVVASEVHIPYLKVLKFVKNKYGLKTCLIVPDLPEHIIGSKSFIYKFFKRKNNKIAKNYCKKYVDSYMFFTEQMIHSFDVTNKPFIVREGIINNYNFTGDSINERNKSKKCVYVGKTNEQNGILLICEAAKKMPNVMFEIYGNGEMDDFLLNQRIENLCFYGFKNPNEIETCLKEADVLLSPRYPRDYTSFSFPSKILKYISYGKPIVTFKLPCYPDSFSSFLYYPDLLNIESLVKTIDAALNDTKKDVIENIIKNTSYLLSNNIANDFYKLIKKL